MVGSLGDLLTVDCPLCGASVRLQENVKRHEEWHERQTEILEKMAQSLERLAGLLR
jgi:hypothetical protein